MKRFRILSAGMAALMLLSAPAVAGDIKIKDPYMRTSTPSSVTGAAFLVLMNTSDEADTLLSATSDIAGRVELHTHKEDENGVMKMLKVEEGIEIPAGGMRHLKRGGDHIMFMGLSAPLEQGQEVTVTLTFEKAGEVEVIIPVDSARKPEHGKKEHSHGTHAHDS